MGRMTDLRKKEKEEGKDWIDGWPDGKGDGRIIM